MLGALQRNSLLAMVSGLLLWTLYFLFNYAFLSLGCALGFAEIQVAGLSLVHWVILAVTPLVLLAMVYLAWRSWQQYRELGEAEAEPELVRRQRFMALVAVMIHGLAVIALCWVATPVLMGIPPCL